MANAAFLLLFGALIIWMYTSGKLAAIVETIKTNKP